MELKNKIMYVNNYIQRLAIMDSWNGQAVLPDILKIMWKYSHFFKNNFTVILIFGKCGWE